MAGTDLSKMSDEELLGIVNSGSGSQSGTGKLTGVSDDDLLNAVGQKPKPTEPWWDTADAGIVVLSPVALVAAFLLVRAIAIRSRPLAEREAARRVLGVWPRLLIVLSCFWSCLLLGLVAWVAAHGERVYPTWQMFVVTIAPLLGMWVIYFAARWIRQGAA